MSWRLIGFAAIATVFVVFGAVWPFVKNQLPPRLAETVVKYILDFRTFILGTAVFVLFPVISICTGNLWLLYDSGRPQVTVSSVKPDVISGFQALLSDQAENLGSPTGAIIQGQGSYEAWHEHAVVVWIAEPRAILCVISKVPSDGRSFCEDEIDRDYPSMYQGNSKKFRSMFEKIPDNMLPPSGGAANHWLRNPQKWSWIGFVEHECVLTHPAYYWRTHAGQIVGPFRISYNSKDGELFAVSDAGKVSTINSVQVPDCLPARVTENE